MSAGTARNQTSPPTRRWGRRPIAVWSAFVTLLGSLGLVVAVSTTASATELTAFIDLQEKGLHLTHAESGLSGWDGSSRDLSVTTTGPVRFALLYWAGQQTPCTLDSGGSTCPAPQPYRDQEVQFNGNGITGTLIGTDTQPATGDGTGPASLHISYFADVTSIVTAAGTGTHAFSFADDDTASNLGSLYGVSLVVGFTDPVDQGTYRTVIWDGGDFAFGADPTEGGTRSATPITFNHGAIPAPRTAELLMMTGGGTATGPDNVTVSNNPSQVNGNDASDGAAWDLDQSTVNLPANVGTTSVGLRSEPADQDPDQLFWVFSALTVPVTDVTPPACPLIEEAGPPRQHSFSVQDQQSGLASIVVTRSENADTVVPPFTVGTTDPVTVTATRIDQSAVEHVRLEATDVAGNMQVCEFAGPTISGTPPGGSVSEPYSFTFTTTGVPTPSVTKSAGDLPPGLTLSPSGKLSGKPTRAGTYHFTASASNGIDEPATKNVTLVVRALPGLSIGDATTKEGNSGTHGLPFRISMNRTSTVPVTVQWTTANGSATAPSDYVGAKGTLTFSPGQTVKTVSIQVKGDRVREPSQVFHLLTYNPQNARSVDPNAVGGIVNDD